MAAKTREELQAEYQQYTHRPTALNNLEKLLKSDIANCDESIEDAPTPEWAAYWLGAKQDYQLELDVCQEFIARQSVS